MNTLLPAADSATIIRRVRAILLTAAGTVLFIKRVKPNGTLPYHVAPGGGVEQHDASLEEALHREVFEELGATLEIVAPGFVLRHSMAGKNLEEHFFICRLRDLDLSLRHGPEFEDPTRGEYIPEEVALTAAALNTVSLKTPQLATWLHEHVAYLRELAA
ncbi:MAG: NUDIX domain-containing protein [Anaerolineae bacterium]|jgi:8-oxo-dGTP pyrophosphatase MutT (NUDIX family)|nr:NUDIX domain-containing protein [Anaerolineae bacterium]